MTNEEKQLLIDLCARLPYGVCIAKGNIIYPLTGVNVALGYVELAVSERISIEEAKPYLRPMSSMTIEEGESLEQIAKETLGDFMFEAEEDGGAIYHMGKWKILSPAMFDYLNSIHIDYRGLIEMDLALEAPERMYNL